MDDIDLSVKHYRLQKVILNTCISSSSRTKISTTSSTMLIPFISVYILWLATETRANPDYSPYVPAPPGKSPPCARASATFCENVDSYPRELIQRLLQYKFSNLQGMLIDESKGLDEPPDHILHQEMPINSHKSRDRRVRSIGRYIFENSMPRSTESDLQCPIITKSIAPEVGMNLDGEWRYIAKDGNLIKNIEVQVCNYKDSDKCKDYCTQLYKPLTMQSLGLDGVLRKEMFWMPSACRCPTNLS